MIRRPPRSTLSSSSAASDVYKRQPRLPARHHSVTGGDRGGRQEVPGPDRSGPADVESPPRRPDSRPGGRRREGGWSGGGWAAMRRTLSPARRAAAACAARSWFSRSRVTALVSAARWDSWASSCWCCDGGGMRPHSSRAVSYTHLRAHETPEHLVCRLLLEKKKHN